ncbi:hypothetical protein RJ641_021271 [Dillenia turbinata]|uniref:SHSP domain-containing protein n=1 Tax=Dillenia turbinata TaxID=194707 RepID=A0AAN8YVI0_9MAGN
MNTTTTNNNNVVRPILKKRRNITLQYDVASNLTEANRIVMGLGLRQKKLKRLPHVFGRVLELPFKSDADVSVEERSDCLRFIANVDKIVAVRAHTVEIHPGVVKIVIRESGNAVQLLVDELELDLWRFRLPASTRPELASAECVDGELVVTVPKGVEMDSYGHGGRGGGRRGGDLRDGAGRLVLVQ